MDYLNELAQRRARRKKEKEYREDKGKWDLSPEKFEEPIGLLKFLKSKKDMDEEDEEEELKKRSIAGR